MQYLALYRKYRPQSLDEVAGQIEIKKILASSVANGTISHAYLFSGPRGTGKTTMAKLLAKMVNCLSPVDGCPCGECDSCKNIFNSNDIIEIDAASNNGVDEIRELREKANLVPGTSKYKVYIIDEVHMLTTQAFNALLKTLEEPPKHVIFILATTEYHKIPLTITSRCQKFQFNKIGIEDIVLRLKYISSEENIDITEEAMYEIAKISDGGMRDSINLLDQLRSSNSSTITISDVYDVCGNMSALAISSLLINVHNNDALKVVEFFEDMSNSGKSYGKFFEDMLSFMEDVILYKKEVSSKYLKSNIDNIKNVSELFSYDEVFKVVDLINKLLEQLRYISRQSVLIVTGFLKLMSEISVESDLGILKTDVNSDKLNFTSSKKDNTSEIELDKIENNEDKKEEIKEKPAINKEIIINNAFSVADKNLKKTLQDKFLKVSDYLTDKYFSQVAGMLSDVKIEVAGVDYLILSCDYQALVNSIYNNYKLCEELITAVLGDKYNFVVITNEEWLKYKQEYIDNLKKGKKYNIMLLDDRIVDIESLVKEPTAVDKLFSIVGEENVEFK